MQHIIIEFYQYYFIIKLLYIEVINALVNYVNSVT